VEHLAGLRSGIPGISVITDVFDQHDLFDLLDDSAVLQLSRLGGAAGFSGLSSIRKCTGIRERRILRAGITVTDIAVRLCERLEDEAHIDLRDCHSILLCHSHTDNNACRRLAQSIELKLGLPEGLVEPFNHGCTGFLKLMQDASAAFEDVPPGGRIALMSIETPEFWHDGSDRLFCGLVSAGATGAIIEHGGFLPLERIAVEDFYIPPDRRPNPNPLFHNDNAEVFSFRGQRCHRTVMRMNPESVFIHAIELMLSSMRAAVDSFDLQHGERVIVIPHQPSAKLLKALVAIGQAEFPDAEFLSNLWGYGNAISSCVPTVLSRLDEVLKQNGRNPVNEGDHLILLAAGICMSDIANKMSAGFAHIRWTPVDSALQQEAAVAPPLRGHSQSAARGGDAGQYSHVTQLSSRLT